MYSTIVSMYIHTLYRVYTYIVIHDMVWVDAHPAIRCRQTRRCVVVRRAGGEPTISNWRAHACIGINIYTYDACSCLKSSYKKMSPELAWFEWHCSIDGWQSSLCSRIKCLYLFFFVCCIVFDFSLTQLSFTCLPVLNVSLLAKHRNQDSGHLVLWVQLIPKNSVLYKELSQERYELLPKKLCPIFDGVQILSFQLLIQLRNCLN
jgi:hypothetical protein